MSAKDGGPAFPQPPCPDCGTRHEPEHVPGISVRDYFAGHALAGWNEATHRIAWNIHEWTPDAKAIAATCYAIADAMLAERERERGGQS